MALELENLKQQLHDVLDRKLVILRSMLTSIRHEKHLLTSDQPSAQDQVIEGRLDLVIAFEKWNHSFMQNIQDFAAFLNDPVKEEVLESFAHTLEWLQSHLLAADVELLLMCEQLTGILQEIKGEAASLVHLTGKECARSSRIFSYAKAAVPAPVHTTLALMDREE